MWRRGGGFPQQQEAVELPIWRELLAGAEEARLRRSMVYRGFGVPHGDGSAVVVIPGFLGTDLRLAELRAWLCRIGYRGCYSGMRVNADCPNLLVHQVADTIRRCAHYTGKPVHLIGYSYGGLTARVLASRMPDVVRSVITLGTPFRGIAVHPSVLVAAGGLRAIILSRHADAVQPGCFTAACTCDFLRTLGEDVPPSVFQAAIYSRVDGWVDWRVCKTGDASLDFDVDSTHIGLVCNDLVYGIIARCLARAR